MPQRRCRPDRFDLVRVSGVYWLRKRGLIDGEPNFAKRQGWQRTVAPEQAGRASSGQPLDNREARFLTGQLIYLVAKTMTTSTAMP